MPGLANPYRMVIVNLASKPTSFKLKVKACVLMCLGILIVRAWILDYMDWKHEHLQCCVLFMVVCVPFLAYLYLLAQV